MHSKITNFMHNLKNIEIVRLGTVFYNELKTVPKSENTKFREFKIFEWLRIVF